MNHRSSIWASLIVLLLFAAGCGRSGIEVTVIGLTPDTKSLLVLASLRNHPTAQLIQPVNGRLDSFWIQVPADDDVLMLNVGAIGETGCRVAEGTVADVSVPTDRIEVVLTSLAAPGCSVRVALVGDGQGKVVSEPAGIDCPGTCTATFEPGAMITLRGIPSSDVAFFAGWAQACSGIGECRLRVTDSQTVVQAGFLSSKVCRGAFCWESPLPQGNALRALYVRSEQDAWAVGGGGTILHWIGSTWAPVRSGTSVELWGIYGRDDKLWVVGDGGTILYYDGASFSSLKSPTTANLTAISGNATEIFIAGEKGTFLKGTGSVFGQVGAAPSVTLHGLSVSDTEVWAVGDTGTALRYRSGRLDEIPTGTSESLASVTERASGEVWAAGGNGVVLKWNGAAFSKQILGSKQSLRALWRTPKGELFCVGDVGTLFRFDGSSWTSVGTGTVANLFAVHGSAAGDAWAAGDAGTLLRWNGVSWTSLQSLLLEPLLSVGSMDGTTLLSMGSSGRIRQRIAGVWHLLDGGPGFSIENAWIGAGEVWAVSGNLLFRWAVPAGETKPRWTVYNLAPFVLNSVSRRSYDPTGKQVDVQVVSREGVHFTITGSPTAPSIVQRTLVNAPLHSVTSLSATEGWTVGDAGIALHLIGGFVVATASNTTNQLINVFGLSADDVWAVGENGTILHWDSIGWSKLDGGTNRTLRGIWASSPTDVWIVGDRGTVLFYDGKKFTAVPSGASNDLYAVTGTPSSTVFVVGESSAILSGGRSSFP